MKTTCFFLVLLLTAISCKDNAGNTLTGGPQHTSQTPVTSTPSPSSDAWTEEFMDLINNHRREIGLRSLNLNEDLSVIVRRHSQDMASGTVAFGHSGFSTRCSGSYDVLGGGNWCGENVAMGQKTPEAAFNAWMNSPGHRANIESPRATDTGFGYAQSASGTYYWTQIFLQH